MIPVPYLIGLILLSTTFFLLGGETADTLFTFAKRTVESGAYRLLFLFTLPERLYTVTEEHTYENTDPESGIIFVAFWRFD